MHCLIWMSKHGWCWCLSCGLCSASLATPQADIFSSSQTTLTSAVNRCTIFLHLWRSLIRSLLQNHQHVVSLSILQMTCSFWKPVSHWHSFYVKCYDCVFVTNPSYASSGYCAVAHGVITWSVTSLICCDAPFVVVVPDWVFTQCRHELKHRCELHNRLCWTRIYAAAVMQSAHAFDAICHITLWASFIHCIIKLIGVVEGLTCCVNPTQQTSTRMWKSLLSYILKTKYNSPKHPAQSTMSSSQQSHCTSCATLHVCCSCLLQGDAYIGKWLS